MSNLVKHVLIVASDYGVMRLVRQSLAAEGFILQTAYSHLDGLYALENGQFDVVCVEGLMADHRSGQLTFLALAQQDASLPVVIVAESVQQFHDTELPRNVSLTGAVEAEVYRVVASILDLEAIPTPEAVAPQLDPSVEATIEAVSIDTSRAQAIPVPQPEAVGHSVDEVQTLFALSQSLTEVLDLSEVLNRVVEAARLLSEAEEGMILLPDDEAGQLYLRAKVGIDVEVARNFRVKTEDTLAGRVFGAGQPVLIGRQGPQKVKTEYLVNALLYVPILYEGRCIGVLGVNNKTTDAVFTPKHQDLLMNLAAFAAIAIENARIHEEALERTRELQVLVEASHVLNASLSLDHVLPKICEQLMAVVNVNHVTILEWNREAQCLNMLARHVRAIWASGQGPRLDISSRLVLRHVLERNVASVISRRDEMAPPGELEYLDEIGADTVQMLPIVGGDQVLGVVEFVYARAPEQLPGRDIINRIQLMTLEVLAMLSSQSNLSRSQGIIRIIENALHLVGADWADVALIGGQDRHGLSVHVSVGSAAWSAPPYPIIDIQHFDELGVVLDTQSPIVRQNENNTHKRGVIELLDVAPSRTAMALPLIQRGQTKGVVLLADTRRGRVFDSRDIDKGRAIVAQAATALENARLVHHLERSLIELRETQERLVQTARLSAMGELAAAVAHQINNPLTTIMVDSEMMLLDESPDSRNYRSLQAIHRAGKRASGVARRLLAISRPTDPESPPERIDVVDTILGVMSLVKAHIERDRIEITVQMPEEPLPPVWAVQGQLDDIWLNLLLNGHDALIGRDGAQLGIMAYSLPDEGVIEVLVWDNGPGIPVAIIEDVFRPFFTTKPVGEGTGLGLHICKRTAESVGGSISVQSDVEQGARFTVRLPTTRGEQ